MRPKLQRPIVGHGCGRISHDWLPPSSIVRPSMHNLWYDFCVMPLCIFVARKTGMSGTRHVYIACRGRYIFTIIQRTIKLTHNRRLMDQVLKTNKCGTAAIRLPMLYAAAFNQCLTMLFHGWLRIWRYDLGYVLPILRTWVCTSSTHFTSAEEEAKCSSKLWLRFSVGHKYVFEAHF